MEMMIKQFGLDKEIDKAMGQFKEGFETHEMQMRILNAKLDAIMQHLGIDATQLVIEPRKAA